MNIDFDKYEFIKFTRQDRILTVSINRPEAMNAVNGGLHKELAQVFFDVNADPDSDVIILTGEGDAFCAGGDLIWLQDAIDDPEIFDGMTKEAKRIFFGQLEVEKPIIAKINGPATGLGASLALVCDVIFASEKAVIADPHVSVGLVAGDGGAVIWPQLVGYARAKEYLLTGNFVSATEAERIGLINHVVSPDELDDAVEAFAKKLAAGATKAIRWTKITANLPLKAIAHQIFDAGLAYEGLSNITEDHQEGITAFRERRKPVYKGC